MAREVREQFRNQVREVTLADLQRVAATYLTDSTASTAVITNPEQASIADSLNLNSVAL